MHSSLRRGVELLAAASFTPLACRPSALLIVGHASTVRRARAPLGHLNERRCCGCGTIMSSSGGGGGGGGASQLGRFARKVRGKWSVEPAAALDLIVPELGGEKHKGQLGRVGVFGGSEDYTGAPYFASLSALRTGADLVYIFTAEEASPALKVYSPELMVTPVYSAAALSRGGSGGGDEGGGDEGGSGSRSEIPALARPIIERVASRLPRLHSLLVGPGLGRHPAVRDATAGMVRGAREEGLPVVLDADALGMVAEDPAAVRGFALAVLTPNANEFRQLCERMEKDGAGGGENSPKSVRGGSANAGASAALAPTQAAPAAAAATGVDDDKVVAVERLARYLGGATIVLKGKVDIISDGTRTVACAVPGGLKRCGGIGDVLSGAMATVMAWVHLQELPTGQEAAAELRLWGAFWACAFTRHASRRAYESRGRATSATDVVDHVGGAVEEVVPSPPVEEDQT